METTQLEKRLAKIGKLEAELKEQKAQITREKRKERNGQLMALGIMVELVFAKLTPGEKTMLRGWAEPLDSRNKQRVLAAFERLAPAKVQEVESAVHEGQPQALTTVRAHLPVSCGN